MSAARKLEQIGPLPKLRAEELEFRVGAAQPNPSEVGPLYKAAYRTSRTQGLRVATALAKTLPDIDHHRQLFQAVALRPAKERRTLIDGYRKAEQDRWVVHAIGELPSAQGRALMKDFVLTETGKKDTKAVREVLLYLADLGATMKTRPVEDDPNDSAIVELVEDIVDAVKQAVDAVVDAIKNALQSIADALVAAFNFTVAQMANLAKALLAAGESIFNIVKGALEAAVADTLAFVKKVDQGDHRRGPCDVPGSERRRESRRRSAPDGAPCDRPARPPARRAALLDGDAGLRDGEGVREGADRDREDDRQPDQPGIPGGCLSAGAHGPGPPRARTCGARAPRGGGAIRRRGRRGRRSSAPRDREGGRRADRRRQERGSRGARRRRQGARRGRQRPRRARGIHRERRRGARTARSRRRPSASEPRSRTSSARSPPGASTRSSGSSRPHSTSGGSCST